MDTPTTSNFNLADNTYQAGLSERIRILEDLVNSLPTGSGGCPVGGWTASAATWTYASADAPTFTFTISGDVTATFYPGVKIKLTQSTVKYFIVTASSYSAPDTTITVYGGTDYTLTSATISSTYYSIAHAPQGFPMDKDKWSIIVTSTSDVDQVTPTPGTWYNLGSISLTIPIGLWEISYKATIAAVGYPTQCIDMWITLSSSPTSEAEPLFTAMVFADDAIYDLWAPASLPPTELKLAAKQLYYLLGMTDFASMTSIVFLGETGGTTYVKAVCGYL